MKIKWRLWEYTSLCTCPVVHFQSLQLSLNTFYFLPTVNAIQRPCFFAQPLWSKAPGLVGPPPHCSWPRQAGWGTCRRPLCCSRRDVGVGEKSLSTPRSWMALSLSLFLTRPLLPVGTADAWSLCNLDPCFVQSARYELLRPLNLRERGLRR